MEPANRSAGRESSHGPDQLRISIALSGGASLGAYEAGALAAVLVGVQRLQQREPERVVVDGIGGASAGALVALLGAYALLEGIDAAEFLHQAWVERVSLDLLRRQSGEGLLSFDRLREDVKEFLDPGMYEGRSTDDAQRSPVGLHVALTGLQGLTYPITSLRGNETFTSVTYNDWGRFVLDPLRGPSQILEPEGTAPLDFVLASASHPGAFRPALLDRSGDAGVYRSLGIDDFPESGFLWYTDGGIAQSEPLGRILAAAREVDRRTDHDGSFRRAVVLIDPRSEDPSGASIWNDPTQTPKWLYGLSRALEIVPTQVVYDDALRVEKANTRLQWLEALVEALEPRLGEQEERALRGFLERVEKDRARSPKDKARKGPSGSEDLEGLSRAELLRLALRDVAGLGGKEIVDLNIITPLMLAESGDDEVPKLLAGEFFGDFGGFLDRDIRLSDFLLGYASAEAWLRDGLDDTGLDGNALRTMAEGVAEGSPGDWREANRGSARPGELPWPGRARMARLLLDALRALGADAVDLSAFSERARRAAASMRGLRRR
ncbi:MAG: patatin-like phospholipase family protein [Actinomycetota bacterium]